MSKRTLFASLIMATLMASSLPALDLLGSKLTPGDYVAELTPRQVPDKTAKGIEKQLDQIDEIGSVHVQPQEGTVHFSVKSGNIVESARLEHAVRAAALDYSIGTPKLQVKKG